MTQYSFFSLTNNILQSNYIMPCKEFQISIKVFFNKFNIDFFNNTKIYKIYILQKSKNILNNVQNLINLYSFNKCFKSAKKPIKYQDYILKTKLTYLFAMPHSFKICYILSINSDFSRAIIPNCYLASCSLPHAV